MLGLAFLGFSITLVVWLMWQYSYGGIREQLKEIKQLETRIKTHAKSKNDYAKQEWRYTAEDRENPRYRNNPHFASKVLKGIEKELNN